MHESSLFADYRLADEPGWPAARQLAFLASLARSGSPAAAAAAVGVGLSDAQRLRRRLGRGSAFGRAWKHARQNARAGAAAGDFLTRNGIGPDQLARLDARCNGFEKLRFALTLARRAGLLEWSRGR